MTIKRWEKVLIMLLCVCMILPCAATASFAEGADIGGAASIEAGSIHTPGAGHKLVQMPTAKRTVWDFDFAAMMGTLDNTYESTIGGNFVLTTDGFSLASDGLILQEARSNGSVRINAPSAQSVTSEAEVAQVGNSFLASYDKGCLMMTLVVNFSALPTVTESAPNENVLSFITWEQKYYENVGDDSTTTTYSRFLCLDENGYLYNNAREKVSAEHQLKAGVNNTITIILDPEGETCPYELYLNGEYVFSDAVSIHKGVSGMKSSCIRVFDNRRQYDVALRSVSLHTLSEDYRLGELLTADWTAYQTTPVDTETGTFDLRLISLLDSLNYGSTGYDIVAVYRDSLGKTGTKTYDNATETVFTSLKQTVNGEVTTWAPSDSERDYILAMDIHDIDADLAFLEFLVRPYTLSGEGDKTYGNATYLMYEGKGEDGYPVFTAYDSPLSAVSASVTEDAHIRFGSNLKNSYSSAKVLESKRDAAAGGYDRANTRVILVKFDVSSLPHSYRYTLDLVLKEGPKESSLIVTPVEPTVWSESSVTGEIFYNDSSSALNYHHPSWFSADDTALTFDYSVASYGSTVSLDITPYIVKALAAEATTVSFAVEYAVKNTGFGGFYSKENGTNAPAISAARDAFVHAVNLGKTGNSGYEPWSYAELVVDDWWNNIRDIYAKSYNGTTVSTDVNAADYTETINVTSSDADWSKNETIAVRTVETVDKANTGFTALASDEIFTRDAYGGLAADGGKYYSDPTLSAKVNGTRGYFGTYYDEVNDRWWYITPAGNRFVTIGMCTVSKGTTAQQALAAPVLDAAGMTYDEWVLDLLNTYGLNTATGSISATYDETQLASGKYNINTHSGVSLIGTYGKELGLNNSIGGSTTFSNNNTINVFDPDFVSYSYARAQSVTAAHKNNPNRIGWTSDNEIPANTDMLMRYLTLDTTDPRNAFSYATAWTWLGFMTEKENPTLADAQGSTTVTMGGVETEVSYYELFRGFVYYRYYAIASGSIKTAAPNQLYMGCRELGTNYQTETVMRVAGYFCDIVTINLYLGADPDASVIANIHKWGGKPVCVTEFYAKALGHDGAENALEGEHQPYAIWEYQGADGNTRYCLADGKTTYVDAEGNSATAPLMLLTSTRGAGKVVLTQKDRAAYYQTFALKMLESGYCIGWSWYRYQDNDRMIYLDTTTNEYVGNTWDLQKQANAGTLDTTRYVVVHKGETDQSNLDSQKGIVDNALNVYTEFAEAIAVISNNVYNLADFFDAERR